MAFGTFHRLGRSLRGQLNLDKKENELQRRRLKLLEDRLAFDIEKFDTAIERETQKGEGLAQAFQFGGADPRTAFPDIGIPPAGPVPRVDTRTETLTIEPFGASEQLRAQIRQQERMRRQRLALQDALRAGAPVKEAILAAQGLGGDGIASHVRDILQGAVGEEQEQDVGATGTVEGVEEPDQTAERGEIQERDREGEPAPTLTREQMGLPPAPSTSMRFGSTGSPPADELLADTQQQRQKGGSVETATRENFELGNINRQLDLAIAQGQPAEVIRELNKRKDAVELKLLEAQGPGPSDPIMQGYNARIRTLQKQIAGLLPLSADQGVNRLVDNLQANLSSVRALRDTRLQELRRPGEKRLELRKAIKTEDAIKDLSGAQQAYGVIIAGAKRREIVNGKETGTNFGDLAMISGFARLLDPGSVVRPSEFTTVETSRALINRILGWEARVRRGERLTDTERQTMLDVASNIMTEYNERVSGLVRPIYEPLAQDVGIPFRQVAPELHFRQQPPTLATQTQSGRKLQRVQ